MLQALDGFAESGCMLSVVLAESVPGLRGAAAIVLVLLWAGAGWAFLRRRRLRRELVADEAMPAPAPRALVFVVLTALFVGFSGLMLYFIFG
jgi:hypothetical protein